MWMQSNSIWTLDRTGRNGEKGVPGVYPCQDGLSKGAQVSAMYTLYLCIAFYLGTHLYTFYTVLVKPAAVSFLPPYLPYLYDSTCPHPVTIARSEKVAAYQVRA